MHTSATAAPYRWWKKPDMRPEGTNKANPVRGEIILQTLITDISRRELRRNEIKLQNELHFPFKTKSPEQRKS